MTEYCVLQNTNIILSFESDKILSKFWPKLTFVQHLQQCKRLTKFRILITFWLLKNVNIISTNVTIILAFCLTQKGLCFLCWFNWHGCLFGLTHMNTCDFVQFAAAIIFKQVQASWALAVSTALHGMQLQNIDIYSLKQISILILT